MQYVKSVGVPVPPIQKKRTGKWANMAREMKVGESILFPAQGKDEISEAHKASISFCRAMNRRYGSKSSVRRLMGDGITVWRIK